MTNNSGKVTYKLTRPNYYAIGLDGEFFMGVTMKSSMAPAQQEENIKLVVDMVNKQNILIK